MGGTKAFFGKFVKHGYTHGINPELDTVRSEWPVGSANTGLLSFTAGSAGPIDSFDLAIASGHVFHVRTLIIDCPDEAQQFYLFDGPGTSVPLFRVQGGASTTEVITGLEGIVCQSVLCASSSSSAAILRIGGLIRERVGEP